MSLYSIAVASLVALTELSQSVHAQQTWSPFIGFGSGPVTGESNPLSSMPLVVQPGALVESPRGSMLARWTSTLDQPVPQFGDADLGARARLSRLGRYESSLIAAGHYDRGAVDGDASSTASLRFQVGGGSPSRGMQFGVGADAWRSNADQRVAPASTVSGWIRRFGLSFTAEVSAHALPGSASGIVATDTGRVSGDTLPSHSLGASATDTLVTRAPPFQGGSSPASSVAGAHTFGEARLHVSGMLMSLGLEVEAGMTMATHGETRNFGSAILTRWLSPAIALTGGFVLQPPQPGSTVRRGGALLGIRLAGAPQLIPHFVNAPKAGVASTTVRITGEYTVLDIRAPGAAHLELQGDFTHWLPIALERGPGDHWIFSAKLAPGVHRLVVRVDGGAWLPPVGLPQSVDLYEGNVGVVVVPG